MCFGDRVDKLVDEIRRKMPKLTLNFDLYGGSVLEMRIPEGGQVVRDEEDKQHEICGSHHVKYHSFSNTTGGRPPLCHPTQ